MEIKKNINKIHFDLSNKFSEIKISEKSEKKFGNHIEIIVNESNIELRAIISKKNLEGEKIVWSYLSNPENEESLVERISSVDSFTDDIIDIFEKKRFDSDYLKNKI
jgi:hypothetical protein